MTYRNPSAIVLAVLGWLALQVLLGLLWLALWYGVVIVIELWRR